MQNTHSQRTAVKKLQLMPGDQCLYAPLAIAEQAEHFGKQKVETFGRWVSLYAPFIAFDFAACQVLPRSVRGRQPSPEAMSYRDAPLDDQAIKASINVAYRDG